MWTEREVEERLRALEVGEPGEPPPRRAAVAIVLRLADEADVLLMRRVEREGDPWSGQISLPGGRSEPADPDLLATAVRETLEEVGVDLAREGRVLGHLPPLRARARGRRLAMDVSPFVFAAAGELFPRPLDEAEEVFWLPLRRAARGELDKPFPYREGTGVRHLPSWRYDERVVWGMTHRILSRLLEVLGRGSG